MDGFTPLLRLSYTSPRCFFQFSMHALSTTVGTHVVSGLCPFHCTYFFSLQIFILIFQALHKREVSEGTDIFESTLSIILFATSPLFTDRSGLFWKCCYCGNKIEKNISMDIWFSGQLPRFVKFSAGMSLFLRFEV